MFSTANLVVDLSSISKVKLKSVKVRKIANVEISTVF